MHPILQKISQVFKITFLILLVIALGAGAYFTFGSYSDGVRVGQIVKLSKRGFLFKTWEGELYQGFLESDPTAAAGGIATRSWTFSVQDSEPLIQQMNAVIEKGGKAKVHYHEKLALLPWLGETKYIVDSVEILH
jgi:hypothetical protein